MKNPTFSESANAGLTTDWTTSLSELLADWGTSPPETNDLPTLLAELNRQEWFGLVPRLLASWKLSHWRQVQETDFSELPPPVRFWGSLLRELAHRELSADLLPSPERFDPLRAAAGNDHQRKALLEAQVEYRLWDRAVELAEDILSRNSTCSPTRQLLARALRNRNDCPRSAGIWRSLIDQRPDDADLWLELGKTQMACRDFSAARESLRVAAEQAPGKLLPLIQLVLVERKLGGDGDLAVLERILQIPHASAREYESAVRGLIHQVEPALTQRVIQCWLEKFPADPLALHFQAACRSEMDSNSPVTQLQPELVEREFDAFANSFERRLKLLGYRGIEAVAEILRERLADSRFQRVLDAGCGTGWCGQVLRPVSGQLDGVDLSGEMLRQAGARGLYDNLYQQELSNFLSEAQHDYHLIVCLDTLNYFGELDSIIGAFSERLSRGGVLLFNLELLHEPIEAGYRLQLNGRFAHTIRCVQEALAGQGLTAQLFERRVLRIEKGDPVDHVMVLARAQNQETDRKIHPGEAAAPEFRDRSASDKLAIYGQLVQQEPHSGTAHFHLGNACLASGQLEAALKSFEAAHRLDQDEATLCNLGNTYAQMGNLSAAFDVFEKALRINPDFVPVLNNAGRAAFELGRTDEALRYLNRALEIEPTNPRTHAFLGNVFQANGQSDQAVASFQRSLESDPRQPEIHLRLGQIFSAENRLGEAANSLVRAQQLHPRNPLVYDLLGLLNHHRGQISEAAFCFLQALQLSSGNPEFHSHLIRNMTFDSTVSLNDLVAESRVWARRAGERLNKSAASASIGPRQASTPVSSKHPRSRLRVGLVHADVNNQRINQILSLLTAHLQNEALEVHVYASRPCSDTGKTSSGAGGLSWQAIPFDQPEAMARQIREDAIDILIDIGGHALGNGLTSRLLQPATVQVVWPLALEPPGLSGEDYLLGDATLLPSSHRSIYVEQPLLLGGPFRPFAVPTELPADQRLSLEDGRIRFACLSDMPCLSPDAIAVWAQILLEVEGAVLWLGNAALGDASVQRRLRETFSGLGVAPERIEMLGMESVADKLRVWSQVDIALDSFPVNSADETWEAVLMGRPVVTLSGQAIHQRTSHSLLQSLELKEFVVESKAEYTALAVRLASAPESLSEYGPKLSRRALDSPVCDPSRFALKLENLLRRIREQP